MKYVIGRYVEGGPEEVVLFNESTNHKDFVHRIEFQEIVSAGFVRYDESLTGCKLYVFGESVSLRTRSRKEDLRIILVAMGSNYGFG